jgi:hypothetical protein
MQIATRIPGASYSSGSFVIPFSAMNALLTTTMTSENSVEKLLFGLLEVIYQRQRDGFITQPTLSMEISNRASQETTWEETTGVFSNAQLLSHLVSFNMDSAASFNGDNIHPTNPLKKKNEHETV